MFWREGKLGRALAAFEGLASEDPRGLEGTCALAQARLLRAEFALALEAAELAVRRSRSRHAPSLIAKAFALCGLDRPEEATATLDLVYTLEGALDSRLLAIRGALLELTSGDESTGTAFDLFGEIGGQVKLAEHLGRSEGSFCTLLAAVHAGAAGAVVGEEEVPGL